MKTLIKELIKSLMPMWIGERSFIIDSAPATEKSVGSFFHIYICLLIKCLTNKNSI